MKIKKLLIVLLLVFISATFVLSSASAATIKYPTKYKVKTYNNLYSSSDVISDDDGGYVWTPYKCDLPDPALFEQRGGSKTKISLRVYNNNDNKYHWVDVKSAKYTIKYKINYLKDGKTVKSVKKSKIYRFDKIPKYGFLKWVKLSGPKNSKVLITHITRTEVHRVWNNN